MQDHQKMGNHARDVLTLSTPSRRWDAQDSIGNWSSPSYQE